MSGRGRRRGDLVRAAPFRLLAPLLFAVGTVDGGEQQRQQLQQPSPHEQGWDAFEERFEQAVPGEKQFAEREHPPVKISVVKVPALPPILEMLLLLYRGVFRASLYRVRGSGSRS